MKDLQCFVSSGRTIEREGKNDSTHALGRSAPLSLAFEHEFSDKIEKQDEIRGKCDS